MALSSISAQTSPYSSWQQNRAEGTAQQKERQAERLRLAYETAQQQADDAQMRADKSQLDADQANKAATQARSIVDRMIESETNSTTPNSSNNLAALNPANQNNTMSAYDISQRIVSGSLVNITA